MTVPRSPGWPGAPDSRLQASDSGAVARAAAMPAYTHDAFVAYAGPDLHIARELVSKLQARRVSVMWDRLLHAEESVHTAIPKAIATCRVLVVLVSEKTWNGQHYVTEEVAIAVAAARQGYTTVVPVWLEPIPVEQRPYGIAGQVGIDIEQEDGCLGCVAGAVAAVVLRAQRDDALGRIAGTASDDVSEQEGP